MSEIRIPETADVSGVEWRDIPGYEGIYRVSSTGVVVSLARGIEMPHGGVWQLPRRVMSTRVDKGGYARVMLSKNNRQERRGVHQLVARAFHADTHFPGAHVCHRDGNPANNRACNLKWGTPSENVQDSIRHGTQVHARKTHCSHGHRYDELNTRFTVRDGGTRRECRACGRIRAAAKRAAKRPELELVAAI